MYTPFTVWSLRCLQFKSEEILLNITGLVLSFESCHSLSILSQLHLSSNSVSIHPSVCLSLYVLFVRQLLFLCSAVIQHSANDPVRLVLGVHHALQDFHGNRRRHTLI